MRRIKSVLRLFFSCLFPLLIAFLSYYLQNQKQIVSNMVVEFSNQLTYIPINKKSIIDIYNNFQYNNDSLTDINIGLLEELINSNIYIEQAEVYLSVDKQLNILVELKRPVFRLLDGQNVLYTDFDGNVLPKLKGVDEKLIVLTGDIDLENDTNLTYILGRVFENKYLKSLVGGVHFDINRGYILSLFDCSIDVYLGLKPVLDLQKVNMLVACYNFLLRDLNSTYCSGINLEFDNQIICIK